MDTRVPTVPRSDLIRIEEAMQQTLMGCDRAATPGRVATIFNEQLAPDVAYAGGA